jgi:biopolymer transport protein ExbB
MKSSRKTLVVALAVVALALVSQAAFAQEAAVQEHHKKTMLELFHETGIVGWLMVLVSVAGTALTIEHFINIKREKISPPEVSEELSALLEEGNYDEAQEVADNSGGYVGNLVGAALRSRAAGYEEMIGSLELAAAEETFKLQSKISYLSLLGNIAPLLGLLGTVTGMISSFQTIETLKAPTPKDLASGVYESLVNTTMGLFIAIVFLVLYFIFKNKVTKLCLSMNVEAVDILKPIAAQHGGAH